MEIYQWLNYPNLFLINSNYKPNHHEIMNRTLSKIKLSFTFFLAAISFSSCLVSSQSDNEVLNRTEYAGTVSVRTIRVPMLITKPVIKNYLRFEEDVPREIVDAIGGFKKIRVTLAETTNPKLIRDFRTSINELSGDEWLSVHNGSQWIFVKGLNDKEIMKRITVAISDPETSQLVYVNVKCKLTPGQLSKLVNFAMGSEEGKKFLKEEAKE